MQIKIYIANFLMLRKSFFLNVKELIS